ncbi:MAG: hypothetical protein C4536_01835 [Actinobacteria bacterium]|nr:MAG: hypothetical protein C4536_01835 [Actinomycetota bacterium]
MSGDFFAGIDQTEARIGDTVIKQPVFWKDTRVFAGIFPAPLQELRGLPPEPLVPAQLFPGTGVLQLNPDFSYKNGRDPSLYC